MAAVRGLRVSVKAEAPAAPALGLPSPEAESGLERGEPEPMEVEEGELEIVPVRRSLKELIPVRGARRRAPRDCPAPELPEGAAAGARAGESQGKGERRASARGRGRRAWGEAGSGRKDAGTPGNGC